MMRSVESEEEEEIAQQSAPKESAPKNQECEKQPNEERSLYDTALEYWHYFYKNYLNSCCNSTEDRTNEIIPEEIKKVDQTQLSSDKLDEKPLKESTSSESHDISLDSEVESPPRTKRLGRTR